MRKTNLKIGKTFLVVSIMILFTAITYGSAYALGGECYGCHTMHSSQDAVSSTANNQLLLFSTCIGCHSAATGKTNANAPVVLHTNDPAGQGNGKTLAGGDYYWVNLDEVANTTKGHNVLDLTGVTGKDANMPNFTPPGWDPSATTGLPIAGAMANGDVAWASQLTCAGQYGCHGKHNVATADSNAGIQGAHHGNVAGGGSDNAGSDVQGTVASAPTTVGGSYRFLGGIKGLEDENWNWNETTALHNEYYGANNTADRSAGANYGTKDTISFLCAECHGVFHGTISPGAPSGSPWVRHPTDIVLPNSGEFDDYNSDNNDDTAGLYSLEVPVARGTVPTSSSSTVTPGNTGATGAIVMCLSCHRAHGSEYADLLRFDYTTMIVNSATTNGCFTCHTDKNS
jgi:predicted CXXCH cytochrome family protein